MLAVCMMSPLLLCHCVLGMLKLSVQLVGLHTRGESNDACKTDLDTCIPGNAAN